MPAWTAHARARSRHPPSSCQRRRMSCGTASEPIHTKAFCSNREASAVAATRSSARIRMLSSPSQPPVGSMPTPENETSPIAATSSTSVRCRVALVLVAKNSPRGFHAVMNAAHCASCSRKTAVRSGLNCPIRSVKARGPRTRYSVASYAAMRLGGSSVVKSGSSTTHGISVVTRYWGSCEA
jgi:hypothetical protein